MGSTERLLEQVLILRCQLRDTDALTELISRHEAQLRYFIDRLLDDAEAAEDILQDTWLTVIRRIHTLKKPEAFATWLYRIARNRIYQQLRRRKTLSELNEDTVVSNGTEDEVFSPEDVARIHVCLKRLKPEHREVLMLRFLEEMPYEHIARVTDCNLGTVKSRVHYAKQALREEMEK
jgi:RNA polymerase sigma-70 factor (ECF subfamily)